MRKASTYDSPIDLVPLNKKELEKVVSVWAKRANTRLRELEKKGVQNISNAYIHLRGMEALGINFMDRTKNDEIKFKTKVKNRTLANLRQEARQLKIFLFEAKTSTPKGAEARFQKQFESFNKTMEEKGIKPLEFKEFAELFNMSGFEKAVQMWGSAEAVEIYQGTYGNLPREMIDELVNAAYDKLVSTKIVPSIVSFKVTIADRIKENEKLLQEARENLTDVRNEMTESLMDEINKIG